MTRSWSIRGQLLLWLIPLLIAIRLFSGYVVLELTKNAITSAYDSSLENSASALAAQVTHAADGLVLSLPPLVDRMLRSSEQDTIYYQVTGPHGERIGGNAVLPALAPNQPMFETLSWDGKLIRRAIRHFLIPSLPSAHSVPEQALNSGDNLRSSTSSTQQSEQITVQVAETMAKRSEATEESVFNILIQQLVAMLAVVLAVWWVIRRSMGPVAKIQREIEQRSGFDFRSVDVEPAPTEIKPLIHTINALLKRVGSDVEAQRRFASNAAHQLRTPLAGVRAHAEVARQAKTLDEAKDSIDQLLEGTDRCTHLVKQLLSISRVEPGARDNVALTPLDLGEIARECCKLHLAAARRKSIDLGYEGVTEPLSILGNRTCLQEMFTNLIDNAIKYSPPGSTVTLRLECVDSTPIVTVEDNGPGIPLEEQERVFERFYRLLGSGQDGSGLGLAIVREVAALHGATVSIISSGARSGLIVQVTFGNVRKEALIAKAS